MKFILEIDYLNHTSTAISADVYIILDVYGSYWFWPSWNTEADFAGRTLLSERTTSEIILDFVWPDYEGYFDGVILWAAALEPGTTNLIGPYDQVSFGANG